MAMKLNSDETPGGETDYLPDRQRAAELRDQAARCRRLASSALDRLTLDTLHGIARECEDEAEKLGRAH